MTREYTRSLADEEEKEIAEFKANEEAEIKLAADEGQRYREE